MELGTSGGDVSNDWRICVGVEALEGGEVQCELRMILIVEVELRDLLIINSI